MKLILTHGHLVMDLLCRYFETFDMVSEESCTTKLEWKDECAKCTTPKELGENNINLWVIDNVLN